MNIYIIIHTAWNTVESVWDDLELARKAVLNHAIDSNDIVTNYDILTRTVNQFKEKK